MLPALVSADATFRTVPRLKRCSVMRQLSPTARVSMLPATSMRPRYRPRWISFSSIFIQCWLFEIWRRNEAGDPAVRDRRGVDLTARLRLFFQNFPHRFTSIHQLGAKTLLAKIQLNCSAESAGCGARLLEVATILKIIVIHRTTRLTALTSNPRRRSASARSWSSSCCKASSLVGIFAGSLDLMP